MSQSLSKAEACVSQCVDIAGRIRHVLYLVKADRPDLSGTWSILGEAVIDLEARLQLLSLCCAELRRVEQRATVDGG